MEKGDRRKRRWRGKRKKERGEKKEWRNKVRVEKLRKEIVFSNRQKEKETMKKRITIKRR